MLLNRVLSLLEEKFLNRLTRNWSKNILMGELNMTIGSWSIVGICFCESSVVGIHDILFVPFEPSNQKFFSSCFVC